MRKISIVLGLFTLLLSSSCVTSKVYDDLRDKYDALRMENEDLMSQLDNRKVTANHASASLEEQLNKARAERSRLEMDLAALQKSYDALKDSYDALEENSSSALSENLVRNRELLEELTAKEKRLAEEEARLEQLKSDLASRSARVDELESMIAAKDAQMRQLKDAVSNA